MAGLGKRIRSWIIGQFGGSRSEFSEVVEHQSGRKMAIESAMVERRLSGSFATVETSSSSFAGGQRRERLPTGTRLRAYAPLGQLLLACIDRGFRVWWSTRACRPTPAEFALGENDVLHMPTGAIWVARPGSPIPYAYQRNLLGGILPDGSKYSEIEVTQLAWDLLRKRMERS